MARSDGTPVGTPRRGARRAPKPKRTVQPRLLLIGLTSFAALLGWAFLVWVAIDYGRSAREGESGKWGPLAATAVAAVACLFLSLWLLTVLLRKVGVLEETHRSRSRQSHRH